MEALAKLSWAALALVHLPPAAVFFSPGLAQRLYGLDPEGELGVLLIHRGALFLALVALGAWSLFDAGARRGAVIAFAISMAGFLYLYWKAGMPGGALRTIAFADLAGLAPLIAAAWLAWTEGPAP